MSTREQNSLAFALTDWRYLLRKRHNLKQGTPEYQALLNRHIDTLLGVK